MKLTSETIIWLFPNIGVFPLKWMVYNGNPYFSMEDLGGKTTIFGNIHIVKSSMKYATFEDLDVEAQRGGRWQGPTTRKCLWSVWKPRGFSAEGMIKRIFHKGFSECLKLGIDDLKKTYDFSWLFDMAPFASWYSVGWIFGICFGFLLQVVNTRNNEHFI